MYLIIDILAISLLILKASMFPVETTSPSRSDSWMLGIQVAYMWFMVGQTDTWREFCVAAINQLLVFSLCTGIAHSSFGVRAGLDTQSWTTLLVELIVTVVGLATTYRYRQRLYNKPGDITHDKDKAGEKGG